MDKPPLTLINPNLILNRLEGGDPYLKELSLGRSRLTALGHVATALHEHMVDAHEQDLQKQLNRHQLGIISLLPAFITASHRLDALHSNGQRLPEAAAYNYKLKIIPFNHALSDLIDMFPTLTPPQVERFCQGTMLNLAGPDEAVYCKERTREILTGMKHELGVEQSLWQIDDVEDVQLASPEQELCGIDRIVIYRGDAIPLDIKASQIGTDKAIATRELYMSQARMREADNTSGYPVWSGLKEEDFRGTFRISDDKAKANAVRLKQTLDRLYLGKQVAL